MDLHFSRFPGFKSPQLGFVPVVQTRIVLASSRHWATLPMGILSPLAHRTCCLCLSGAWVCLSKETLVSELFQRRSLRWDHPRAYQNFSSMGKQKAILSAALAAQPMAPMAPWDHPAPIVRSERCLVISHLGRRQVQAGGDPSQKKTMLKPSCLLVTLWLFNIAMENDPCIDGLPIKNGDFPWLLKITRGYMWFNPVILVRQCKF